MLEQRIARKKSGRRMVGSEFAVHAENQNYIRINRERDEEMKEKAKTKKPFSKFESKNEI